MKFDRLLFAPSKLVAIVLTVFSSGFALASWQLGLWTNGAPGVGLTPMLACAALFVVSLMLLLGDNEEAEQEASLEWTPMIMGFGFCLLAYGMNTIGFVVPALIFLLIWARFLYCRSWLVSVSAAIGITAVLAILFVKIFGVPLKLFPW